MKTMVSSSKQQRCWEHHHRFHSAVTTGLFSLAALAAFARAILPTIAAMRKARLCPLSAAVRFPAYLFVRTSSETLSAGVLRAWLGARDGPAQRCTPGACGPVLRSAFGAVIRPHFWALGTGLAGDYRRARAFRAGGLHRRRIGRPGVGRDGCRWG